jgi:hypothetical protein
MRIAFVREGQRRVNPGKAVGIGGPAIYYLPFGVVTGGVESRKERRPVTDAKEWGLGEPR